MAPRADLAPVEADRPRWIEKARAALIGASQIDRRAIYLLVLAAVAIPTFLAVPTRVPPTASVEAVYTRIEALPPRSLVWVPFDLWASNRAEVGPGALAVMRHLMRRGHRIVATSLIPDGVSISEAVMGKAAAETGRTYGTDWVVLGYKAGNATVIKQACGSLPAAFPVDIHHTPLDQIPLTRDLRNMRQAALVFVVCDNNLFDGYAAIAATENKMTVAGITNAVMVPILTPYVNAGQITGLLGGLRGGAEYESLTGIAGDATAGMTAQSVMHLLLMGLIVTANASYAAERAGRRGRRGPNANA